jgi:hypothetical protein
MQRRLGQLVDQRKAAERDAAEQRAIATAALSALRAHPEIYAETAPRLFVEAAHALAGGDLTVVDHLAGVLASLSPQAAAWIFSDVARARLIVELARRPESLEGIGSLSDAASQLAALGAFAAEVENSRRPIVALFNTGNTP